MPTPSNLRDREPGGPRPPRPLPTEEGRRPAWWRRLVNAGAQAIGRGIRAGRRGRDRVRARRAARRG